MWDKINKYYNPLIDILAFLVLILTVIYSVFHYRELPNEVPHHFNLAGEPDAWGKRESSLVY
ncbi:DUF1648 domain-containing protein [Desertibacillus haloalkaliphilus]|uniref:DUF1648 domain-containing protein n=1 Tax=Desertibacillus haloalkaliphilus TaxID=1328930 RepID=UPI001C27E579|nr:DUF1648 domain-containing protein [Desertibacillus haloalkaliphilus]MBU8906187.1 DUF1648 domain-containing protein [Desertibacillus haloalkaliphilus]